jgi:outer membrane protein assembly factor BamB
VLYCQLVSGTRHASWSLGLAAALAAGVGAEGCGRRGAGSAGATAADASIAWSVDIGCAGSRFGLAVAPDGALYVAGYDRPEAPPPGHASADGFWQVFLLELDASGRVTRRVGGSVTWERPEVWVAVAPWGAGYAVDALGGIYGLLPAGRSRFNEAGMRLAGPITVGHRGDLFVGGVGGIRALQLEATDEPATLLYSTGGSHATAPALGADGSFFFNTSSGGRLLAVSSGGELMWERRVHGASPVLGPEGFLYLNVGTQLQALAASGEAIWDFSAETPFSRAPVPAPDGSLYAVTQSGLVYSVERGRKRWSFPLERPVGSELSVDAVGTVYVLDDQGKLYAVGSDGRRRWALKLPGATGTPVAGPDGTVYVPNADGRLHAITPPPGSA